MVAERVKRKRRGQSPKAAFSQAPKEGVRFQIKRCSFPVGFAPHFGEPSNVVSGVRGVGNGVEGIGGKETDNGVGGMVGFHGELRVSA